MIKIIIAIIVVIVAVFLVIRLVKKKQDRFKTTYDLARWAMDIIDKEMQDELAKGNRVSFEFAKELAAKVEKKHPRLRISTGLGSSALYCRHTVFITGSGQSWFTDNFIQKYENPLIKSNSSKK